MVTLTRHASGHCRAGMLAWFQLPSRAGGRRGDSGKSEGGEREFGGENEPTGVMPYLRGGGGRVRI